MKRINFGQSMAAAIATLGIVLPQAAFAGAPAAGGIADVSLRDGGVMVGAVYSVAGLPQSGAVVSIQTGGAEVARTTTDEHGRFAAQGLKGGVYQVATADGFAMYRAWAPGTAPPAAEQAALVVTGEVARGGHHHGGRAGWLSNPWVLGTIIATAIALPIALSDDDNDSAS